MTKTPNDLLARKDLDASHSQLGLSDLARHALARVCEARNPGGISDVTNSALQDPVPTALAYALCDREEDAAKVLIDDLLAAGVSVEDVCIDHLAPAARRLGEWWETDRLPFTDVTLATARIQSMLRQMPANRTSVTCADGKGAIFAAVPGEQHTLGVMMAADLFRRHGWDVSLLVGQSHDELIDRIARDDRAVIGLSCSGDHSFPALKRLMHAIRRNRPNTHVLLSGQIVTLPDRLSDLPLIFKTVSDVASAEAIMREIEDDLADEASSFNKISG